MSTYVFTSFSLSYLDRAKVFASSIRRVHPEWVLCAIVVDREPPDLQIDWVNEQFDKVIFAEEILGQSAKGWLFGHDVVEACTAVKGAMLKHLMSEPDAEKIIFLDPDIAVFNSLTPVTELLDRYSIVVTPHQIDPEPRSDTMAILDNEVASLKYGIFNLGFIAVKNDEEGRRFAEWWSERLSDWCHDQLEIGIFVDQKWCNLIPCFFENVKVLRDPGYNVASWNISRRKLKFSASGQALVNEHLLRFYHFTKLGPIGAAMTSRYADGNTEIFELWWWYQKEIEKARDPQISQNWWFFNYFDDGTTIPKSARVLYRSRSDLQAAFPDPFMVGKNSFLTWLKCDGGI